MVGDPSNILAYWLPGQDACSSGWVGVQCAPRGANGTLHVVRLVLKTVHLTGALPMDAILQLAYLEVGQDTP